MAEQYKTTPIPDRMVSHRIAKKWHLTAQMKDEEINNLQTEIKRLRKKLLFWRMWFLLTVFFVIIFFVVIRS